MNWKKRELERRWEANPENGGRIFSSGLGANRRWGEGGQAEVELQKTEVLCSFLVPFRWEGSVKKSSRCVNVQL